jgi:hypothetical protein
MVAQGRFRSVFPIASVSAPAMSVLPRRFDFILRASAAAIMRFASSGPIHSKPWFDNVPTTITTTADVQQQLQHVQERAAVLTTELHQAEAERDTLIRQLADSDGAHDTRVVSVR